MSNEQAWLIDAAWAAFDARRTWGMDSDEYRRALESFDYYRAKWLVAQREVRA